MKAENTTRASEEIFCIVDPCLKDFVGHHFEYDQSVAESVREMGFETILLAHQSVAQDIRDEVTCVPVFKHDIWSSRWTNKKIHPFFKKFLANVEFFVDFVSAFSRFRPKQRSIVFCPMITQRQLFALAVYGRFLLKGNQELILLLRYQPDFYTDRLSRLAFMLLRGVSHKRIRVVTDSALLAEEYEFLSGVRVETLPIPHSRLPIARSSEQSEILGGRPVRFVSLGNARDEKGFFEILEAVEILARSGDGKICEFVLQANDPQPDVERAIEKFEALQLPNVRLLKSALTATEYSDLLENSDVVLVPYWSSIYSERTSGIFLEAVTAGKPVIASENTWADHELKTHGAGLICKDRDASSLANAIKQTAKDLPNLQKLAFMRAPAYADFHNPVSFAKRLVNQDSEPRRRALKVPPERALVIYPWGDLYQKKNGASIRSTLLIDFLSKRLKQIISVQIGGLGTQRKGSILNRRVPYQFRKWNWLQRIFVYFFRVFAFAPESDVDLYWHYIWPCLDGDFRRALRTCIEQVDVVFLEYTFFAEVVRELCWELEVPLVITNHDVIAHGVKTSVLRSLVRSKELESLSDRDKLVTVSPKDQVYFSSHGIQTEMIVNPVDFSARRCLQNRDLAFASIPLELRSRLAGRRICMFVGAYHVPNCEAATLMKEFAKSDESLGDNSPIYLVVGSCSEKVVRPNLICTGVVEIPVLWAFYSLADLIVIPLRSGTGASLKTVEAFAAGKPILGSSVAFRGVSGLTDAEAVVIDDFSAYPSKISELLRDQESLDQMGKAACDFARNYDYRVAFKKYLPLIGLGSGELSLDDQELVQVDPDQFRGIM